MGDYDDEDEEGVPGIGTYEGARDPNTQERHGRGRAELKNGDVYEGEYEHGKRHGQGIYRFKNKSRYEGQYVENKKHGKGTFWYPDGSIYDGTWAADVPDGKGTYTYPNGDTYEGDWVGGLKEGQGVYTYEQTGVKGQGSYLFDGHKYVGTYTEDQPLGDGKFIFNHGAEQEGRFVVRSSEDADAAIKAKWVGGAVIIGNAEQQQQQN